MKLINNLYFYPEQGMLDCNTYVITGNPGVIIDPGNEVFLSAKINGLHKDGINPGDISIITNTHLHVDHFGANEAFKELSGAKIAIHPVQKENYRLVVIDGARFFGMPVVDFTEDYCLDGDRFIAGGMELEMIKSPGHSPDCICFYSRQDKVLICGDVIFNIYFPVIWKLSPVPRGLPITSNLLKIMSFRGYDKYDRYGSGIV
jgi:glyoxylase-like metal-dependent hydrolase (beta-lactamase superfamily II)